MLDTDYPHCIPISAARPEACSIGYCLYPASIMPPRLLRHGSYSPQQLLINESVLSVEMMNPISKSGYRLVYITELED